jgi:hypothetical protein
MRNFVLPRAERKAELDPINPSFVVVWERKRTLENPPAAFPMMEENPADTPSKYPRYSSGYLFIPKYVQILNNKHDGQDEDD